MSLNQQPGCNSVFDLRSKDAEEKGTDGKRDYGGDELGLDRQICSAPPVKVLPDVSEQRSESTNAGTYRETQHGVAQTR